jgi:DNA gyrase subunit B
MPKKLKIEHYRDNILNYGAEIKEFTSFVEAVQKLPGMYIGGQGNNGFLSLIREIYQNSMDEMVKTKSPGSYVLISYNEVTHDVEVEDDGRGIPHGSIIKLFTSQHSSSNYEKEVGQYSSGMHGVGAKVTEALSDTFVVESYVLGKGKKVEFKDGFPVTDETEIKNPDKYQGTRIRFHPSYKLMGKITLSVFEVLGLIKSLMMLTDIGDKTIFIGYKADGTVHKEDIVNTDGMMTDLINKVDTPVMAPIRAFRDTGEMRADIMFTYDANYMDNERIRAFANFCPTREGGTHVEGLKSGAEKFFTDYMNKVYLKTVKNNKITVLKRDVMTGFSAIISVAHLNPVLGGQDKHRLDNADMEPFVKGLVIEALNEWSKSNPNDLQKVCKYLKDVTELRLKQDSEKIRINDKYESSPLTGLPSKFVKPLGKKHLELFLVEGDSAKGTTKNYRDNNTQGIFPLRGKIPNAFAKSKAEFLANAEIAGILTILGAGYGKTFDLSKCSWEKVIILTDGDEDGKHIASLLLKFFLLYAKPLVEDGRLYKALPPLYAIKKQNGKREYIQDRLAYTMYLQKLFNKDHKIVDMNGKVLTSNESTALLHMNIDYTYDMNVVSKTYALDPHLLEFVLFNTDKTKDSKKFNKMLKERFRFMDATDTKSGLYLKGLISNRYQTLHINDNFIKDTAELSESLRNNKNLYFGLADKNSDRVVTLYDLMTEFNKCAPTHLDRYKGLGQMDGKELEESTLSVENRTLLRYTASDIAEEIEAIRYLESHNAELVLGVKVSRTDLLG